MIQDEIEREIERMWALSNKATKGEIVARCDGYVRGLRFALEVIRKEIRERDDIDKELERFFN